MAKRKKRKSQEPELSGKPVIPTGNEESSGEVTSNKEGATTRGRRTMVFRRLGMAVFVGAIVVGLGSYAYYSRPYQSSFESSGKTTDGFEWSWRATTTYENADGEMISQFAARNPRTIREADQNIADPEFRFAGIEYPISAELKDFLDELRLERPVSMSRRGESRFVFHFHDSRHEHQRLDAFFDYGAFVRLERYESGDALPEVVQLPMGEQTLEISSVATGSELVPPMYDSTQYSEIRSSK